MSSRHCIILIPRVHHLYKPISRDFTFESADGAAVCVIINWTTLSVQSYRWDIALGQEHRRSYGAPALQVAVRGGRIAERHALADMRLDLTGGKPRE